MASEIKYLYEQEIVELYKSLDQDTSKYAVRIIDLKVIHILEEYLACLTFSGAALTFFFRGSSIVLYPEKRWII